MDNYNEEDNHTGYPLNGGVKPRVSPEQEKRYSQIEAERDALSIDLAHTQELLAAERAKVELLERHNTALLELLKTALATQAYAAPAKPLEFYYGDGFREPWGTPKVTCVSQNQNSIPRTTPSNGGIQPK